MKNEETNQDKVLNILKNECENGEIKFNAVSVFSEAYKIHSRLCGLKAERKVIGGKLEAACVIVARKENDSEYRHEMIILKDLEHAKLLVSGEGRVFSELGELIIEKQDGYYAEIEEITDEMKEQLRQELQELNIKIEKLEQEYEQAVKAGI